MLLNPQPSPPVPAKIRLVIAPPLDYDWMYFQVRLDRWSPFTAACILCEFRPGAYDQATNSAEIIWERDPNVSEAGLESLDENPDFHCREVRNLTAVIAANAASRGATDVVPSEIVAWAVETLTIPQGCELDREFDRRRLISPLDDLSWITDPTADAASQGSLAEQLARTQEEIGRLTVERDKLLKKAKDTGKRFAEQRAAILAAALHRLANHFEECADSKGAIVGAKLAKHVDDHRIAYGFGADDKDPSHTTIRDHINKALSGKPGK
jgi:hypothetical protein